MARVVLENLSKTFHDKRSGEIRAVDHVNLAVEDRELLALVGPSGSGKSTTLRMIAGLEEPTAGTILFDDRVMNDVNPQDRDVAMVFQHYALYPHMTVFENLAFGLKLQKLPRAQIQHRVADTAAILGLTNYLDRLPKTLSGGERQRVALGRALVRRPRVLLLDEPLSNLDVPMRATMRVEIARWRHRLDATLIYVTHDQVEAITLGDRVAVMREGRIEQVADPTTLYRKPANQFVAGFIGSPPMNFLHGTIARTERALVFQDRDEAGARRPGFLTLRVPQRLEQRLTEWAGKDIVLGLRPEHIGNHVDSPDGDAVEAVVEVVEPAGAEAYLHLTAGARNFVARVRGQDRSLVQHRLKLAFDMSQAHFFDPETGAAIG